MDPEQTLTLEEHDDLGVLTAPGDVSIMEQDKHSLNDGALTTKTRCLWEALGLWASKKNKYSYWPRLRLATNRVVCDDLQCLTSTQSGSEEQIQSLLVKLDTIAATKANKELVTRFEYWLGLEDEDRLELLRHLQICEEVGIAALSTAMERALARDAVPAHKLVEFRERLQGWYIDCVSERLTHSGMRIRGFEQKRALYSLFQTCSKVDLRFAYADAHIDSNELIAAGEASRTYQRQLELIDASEKARLEAIDFFHKAKQERGRLLDEDLVGRQDIQDHESELRNQWSIAQSRAEHLASTDQECGLRTYYDCMGKNSVISGNHAPTHLHAGTFHILADGPEMPPQIGWHPRFRKLITKSTGGGDGSKA